MRPLPLTTRSRRLWACLLAAAATVIAATVAFVPASAAKSPTYGATATDVQEPEPQPEPEPAPTSIQIQIPAPPAGLCDLIDCDADIVIIELPDCLDFINGCDDYPADGDNPADGDDPAAPPVEPGPEPEDELPVAIPVNPVEPDNGGPPKTTPAYTVGPGQEIEDGDEPGGAAHRDSDESGSTIRPTDSPSGDDAAPPDERSGSNRLSGDRNDGLRSSAPSPGLDIDAPRRGFPNFAG